MDQTEVMEMVEAYEPFQALMPLLNSNRDSRDRQLLVNDSFMADLLGENPKTPPRSDLAPQTVDLMHAILQIYGPTKRFGVYKTMFQYYPWRNRISKSDHFASACYLFVHECYIFEERLKAIFRALTNFAKCKDIDINLKGISREVMKLHKKTFANALRLRGLHVHQEDFVPREIKRIGLVGLMLTSEKLFKQKSEWDWQELEAEAISQARKQWIKSCEEAERAATRILLATFRPTKSVWSHIADEIAK